MNIAYRQIESQNPKDELNFILTSRTKERAVEAGAAIQRFNEQREMPTEIKIFPLVLDLADMHSIMEACTEVKKTFKAINYVYVNAALGVCSGINWFKAIREVITSPVQAVTDPHYKIQESGLRSKDDMGLVFQANVFGPYYMIRKLLPCLYLGHAVIVWISSIRSDPYYLPLNDLELVESATPYEGSKRMIDVMHLATYKDLKSKGIYQYVVQPGIFVSQSFNVHLNIITYYLMMIMFYFARRWGSYWHTIDPYKAANSAVYVTTFRDRDFERQDLKYGSATFNDGVEHIKPEEINDRGKGVVAKFLESKDEEWDLKLDV